MSRTIRRLPRFLAAALLLASLGGAQSLYTFAPGLAVTELSGPPAPPCFYPAGPINLAFPAVAGPCVGPGPFVAPLGDVAVDPATDLIYVTDGLLIAGYTRFGVHLGSAVSPLPGLTGLAVGGGVLWITDGVVYGAVPIGVGCPVAALPFVVGPFPVPIGPIFAAPIADLDFEAMTGSLIACDGAGLVGSFMPGPAPVLGPYGVFPVAPAGCLGPALVGIAFDKAFPGTGTVFVTDAAIIARLLPGALLAPPTFYFPLNCIPIPVVGIAGLAYAGRALPYGFGADTMGLPPPVIGSLGQSYVGTPAFGITLAGSVPGGVARLRLSVGATCPPPLVLGLPIHLAAPRLPVLTAPVGAGGGAAFVAAIPPATPVGISLFVQWVVLTGASIQVTPGAVFTTILP